MEPRTQNPVVAKLDRSAVSRAEVVPSGEDGEFERFEDLTRQLVNTPKSAIDEKRRAGKDEK